MHETWSGFQAIKLGEGVADILRVVYTGLSTGRGGACRHSSDGKQQKNLGPACTGRGNMKVDQLTPSSPKTWALWQPEAKDTAK